MATSDRGQHRHDHIHSSAPHSAADDGWRRGSAGWSESARQVWLAGVGAWTRAQAEGSRVFDGLVRDGLEAERDGARTGTRGASDAPSGRTTEDVRQFATGAWDRMGQFVEDSVQRAMQRLGVPSREDMDALGRRIDALSSELREARAAGVAGTATPARRRSATSAARKTAGTGAGTGTPAGTGTTTGAGAGASPTRPAGAATRKPPA